MKVKNLIIGGGFAGIYLAASLGDATIIEDSDKVGGLLRSFKSPSGQFEFDIGGHVYTTKHPVLNLIMSRANAVKFDERKAYYDYERKIPYPVQYHAHELGIDIIHAPNPPYPSLASMLRQEFGEQFYSKVLKPFNQRVWSTNPNALDADWVAGRVATIKEYKVGWGTNASFLYARGEDIINALLEEFVDTKIFTSTFVTNIDYERRVAYVDSHSNATYHGEIQYDNLFDTSGYVLTSIGAHLPSNRVLTVGIGLNRKVNEDFHWWYNSVENSSKIHRITLLSRYHHKLAPDGVDSLLVEIPYKVANNTNRGFSIGESNKYAILSMLKEAHFYFINEKDIEEVISIDTRGYPIPVLTHRNKIALTRREMHKHNVYLVGRWGAHGYYNLDHIIDDCGRAISASTKMSDQDYYWANDYYTEKRRF